MSTTVHRRPYTRPSDSDSDVDSDEALDEEQQEALIDSLSRQDAQKTSLYRAIFLAVTLAASLPFLYRLLAISSAAGGVSGRSNALLAASSLWCSAYILWFLPVEGKGRNASGADGPLQRYLVLLGGLLAGGTLIAGLAAAYRGAAAEDGAMLALPAVVFVLILVVRQQLAPLDLEDLQRARYGYKGA